MVIILWEDDSLCNLIPLECDMAAHLSIDRSIPRNLNNGNEVERCFEPLDLRREGELEPT